MMLLFRQPLARARCWICSVNPPTALRATKTAVRLFAELLVTDHGNDKRGIVLGDSKNRQDRTLRLQRLDKTATW